MVRQAPFRAFVLSMENGDRVSIGNPATDFYVISGRVRYFGSFEAVASVATAETVEHLG